MRLSVATAVACLVAGLSLAAESNASIKKYDVDIPRQTLDAALKDLALQTGLQIARMSDTVDGEAVVGPVSGSLTPGQALTSLLTERGLAFKTVNDKTIAIVPTDSRASGSRRRLGFFAAQAETSQGAQVDASGGAKNGENQLSEIVVTATKRQERLQDVPMSISVLSSEAVERRSLKSMDDYLRTVPGVTSSSNNFSSGVTIRGLAGGGNFIGSGATVAVYFDEMNVSSSGGLFGNSSDIVPVDLERIEILRGPQGTSFGDASLGGTVRWISAKPKLDQFGLDLTAEYSNTAGYGGGNSMYQGIVNIPVVTDKLAIRAVGYRVDQGGYYSNVTGVDPGQIAFANTWNLASELDSAARIGGGRITTGGRMSVLWNALDNLSVQATYLHEQSEEDPLGVTTIDGRAAQYGEYATFSFPIVPKYRIGGSQYSRFDTELNMLNLTVNYDFSKATLTTAASYTESDPHSIYDQSSSFGVPVSQDVQSHFRGFAAETRLASHLDGRIQYLIGAFHQKLDNDSTSDLVLFGPPVTYPASMPDELWGHNLFKRPITQNAAFGELSLKLTEQLTATIGGRYFEFDRGAYRLREGRFYGVALGSPTIEDVKVDANDSSFKANLTYRPNEDAMLYASWAQGFRLGRPDLGLTNFASQCDTDGDGIVDGTNVRIADTTEIKSDTVDNFELGSRLSFLDRRLTIGATVYHLDWKNLPSSNTVVCGGITRVYAATAGAAVSNGVEIEASFRPTPQIRIDAGAGYTEAKLAKDAPNLGAGALDGASLPAVPEVSANVGLQYDFSVGRYNAFVSTYSAYVGEIYSTYTRLPASRYGDYIRFDARAGISIGQFRTELFVDNLTNSDAWTIAFPGLAPGIPSGARLRPRTVGVTLGYSFK